LPVDGYSEGVEVAVNQEPYVLLYPVL